ncbi:hypothetical protein [Paractinoplanes atraurantiacus]|uniref:AAA ATPase domain-containing protein n=1 Tax=Paractinoplanes atraurantiacus TaxID=1036182 RepID=A0A285JM88_9ACTN|nr:hypothetical protein [Actinoplanes atraurantiacus]SNY60211.1 hypothetical protein SAMN05421748_12173 [Actinoplanes atraurantiacus]
MRVPPPGGGPRRDGPPHAGELFTDRESESQAFRSTLKRFRRMLDSDDEVGAARHNVLTFYGMGGIGKTALSERLEAWVRRGLPIVNGWGALPSTKVDATARIDLHGSAGQMDLPAALLAMRAGLAHVRRRWPVFDLAFAAYWSAVRPGEPLPAFRGRDELENVVAETAGEILKDLGSAAEWIVGTPTTLGVRGVRKLVGELRRQRELRLAIEAYPGFEDFLLRCADEPSPTEPRPALACEIAAALSWELAQITPAPLLVVFVDTTERLALDPRRVSEGHLNKLVHGMPNVLFVLTGREMIDWYDEKQVDVVHRGPWTWPGLVPGADDNPRQHLVGNLSPADTRALILRARERQDLPMDDDVVDELVRSSAGLPQYLELARQVALSIKDAGPGRRVEASDVTGSLGSLVMRILDDVPPDEQRAIRAAALFRLFDPGLIAAAAGVDHGCAERAVRRPMIDRHGGGRFPYRMHDAVREAIRKADHQIAHGWSERDWELAAGRAAAEVRRLHDEAKDRGDNRAVLDLVGLAVVLVCEQRTDLGPPPSETYVDWLSRAIVFSPSVQGLRSRVPAESETAYGRLVLDFIRAKDIETPFDERIALLRGIFDADHALAVPAGRHLGYALRGRYRWGESLAVFDELVARSPSRINLAQGPLTLSMARRFADARTAGAGTKSEGHIRRMAEYAHGRPERYFAEVADKVEMLRSAGRQREHLEELGTLLARKALLRDDVHLDEVLEFAEQAELAGHVVATRSALLATVLLHRSDPADIAAAIGRLRVLDEMSQGRIGFRYATAEACTALLAGDHDRLARLRDELAGPSTRGRDIIPVECLLRSSGLPLPDVPTQWLEPVDDVVRRWAGHFRQYVARRAQPS